jgi:predicted transcriptional regulator
MKYRSRTDIISEILDAANGGGGATKDKDIVQGMS